MNEYKNSHAEDPIIPKPRLSEKYRFIKARSKNNPLSHSGILFVQ